MNTCELRTGPALLARKRKSKSPAGSEPTGPNENNRLEIADYRRGRKTIYVPHRVGCKLWKCVLRTVRARMGDGE